VLLMPAVLVASYVVMRVAHLPLPVPEVPWTLAPVLFLVFFVTAAGEELAWSATVLDPLQSRLGALRAALVIGVIWAVWHVVPFAQGHPSVAWVSGQLLFTVAFRVVLVWLYNNTSHSVFATIVAHATYNVAWQLFPNRGSAYDPWIVAAITVLVAFVVTLASGARTLCGRARVPS
jgi:membrane protease YdiL (CAAX protease family)